MKGNSIIKSSIFASAVCAISMLSYSNVAIATQLTYSTIREIAGLKCPNHDHVKDNHNFMYQDVNGNPPTTSTRCMRCNKTKGLHKPQK